MLIRPVAGLTLALLLLLISSGRVKAQDVKRLSEDDLIKLIELQIEDSVVVARIARAGVDFAPDQAVLDRLKKAGASGPVLLAVKPDTKPDELISYDGILQLLKRKVGEDQILKRLENSPTTFTLDQAQVASLKEAGASVRLLEALKGFRAPALSGSDISDLVVILDCSGSMMEQTPDGISKMDAAKKVVTRFINNIPEGKRLSFIVYGITPLNNRSDSCEDVKVVLPLSPVDAKVKEQLVQFIAGIKPYGATPLTLSLRAAGKQLEQRRGLCQLVLITDGMETCDGNPGQVAEELNREINLPHGIDVVGFGVSDREKAALQEIVARGRGHFYAATNADELDKALKRAGEEATKQARTDSAPASVKTNQGESLSFSSKALPWADRVVSFRRGNNIPANAEDPKEALGKPDYDEKTDRNYVALGLAGELVLEFVDNRLIDVPGPDLAIFEIGPVAESVSVAISDDGTTWIDIGRTTGGKSTLDIAKFVKPGQRFRFVKLTDPDLRDTNDGADIDAVGAIGSVPAGFD